MSIAAKMRYARVMAWVSLTVDVAYVDSEFVQSLMFDSGAAGIEVRDHENPVMPGVEVPRADRSLVIGYFEDRRDAESAQGEIDAKAAPQKSIIEDVVMRDWSVEWRNQIRSISVGRLWVGPPWEKATAPTDKTCLFIEPKMAFGTGDHPTTSLCLRAVDDFMASHPKASVLDVGTGTGVLAFAAKKLGADRTVGIDNDPIAVELAQECAQENNVADVELSTKTLHGIDGTFDLVLANILANTLIELAPLIAPKVARQLVLAGVLVPQADDVKRAFLAQGLVHQHDEVMGEWIRIDFQRR